MKENKHLKGKWPEFSKVYETYQSTDSGLVNVKLDKYKEQHIWWHNSQITDNQRWIGNYKAARKGKDIKFTVITIWFTENISIWLIENNKMT